MTNLEQELTMLRSGRIDTSNLSELVKDEFISQEAANIFGREKALLEAAINDKGDYAGLAKAIPALG